MNNFTRFFGYKSKATLFVLFLLFGLMYTSKSIGQSAGFNTTYIVLSINGGSNAYYDLQATTGNPDFDGANLGTFCQGSTTGIVFKGAEHNIYKCGGCDLTSTRLYYRIYPTGSPSGSFTSNNIGYSSGFNNGCGGQDQQWSNTGFSTDLISSLGPGNYTLDVYSDATVTCSGGTVYASNSGSNYKATFTINATSVGGSVTGGTSICTGSTSGTLTLSGHTGSVVRWESSVSPFSSWTTIANTSTTYTSGALTQTTKFRAVVQSGVCSEANSADTTVTVDPASVGGSVTGGTTICEGSTSGTLTLSGHTGSVVRWERSISPFSSWSVVPHTSTTYTSGSLSQTTKFRAVVQSGVCSEANSADTTVTVDPASVGGSVTGGTTICEGSTSGTLTLSGLTGSVVRWERSISPFSSWSVVPHTSTTYTSGSLSQTTKFRAVVQSGVCSEANSADTTVTVDPASVGGSVTGGTTICEGSTSGTLTLSGHAGSVVRWESSVSPFSSWTTIANSSTTYTSGALTQTTKFRAVVQSGVCSEANSTDTTVTVDPASVGGSVTGGTTICEGSTSGTLTLSGHTGSVVRWESSVNPFSSWTTIANTSTTYTSGSLTQTTKFRAVVQSGVCSETNSADTTVTVDPVSVGGSVTGGTSICSGATSGTLTLSGHTGSVVRWESSVSPFSSWTTIANTSTTYTSGALTQTTKFRAVVQSGVCSEAASSDTTVSIDSTTWDGSSWSAGSPTSTSAVIFTGNYTISSDLSVCTITVTNSAVVSVDSGIDVTLNGALTVSSGSFTLNNTANLIQTTNASNSGNIIVKRNSSAIMRLDYTLWCSPVSGSQTLLNFSPNTLVDRFYEYNPSTDEYNSVVPSTTTFGLAKGYLIRVRNAFPTTPTVWPGTFTGVPNNGNITYAMASGFNAVGNPYPSRLNVADFIDGNTATTGTLYFWRKSNNAANTSYATVTKIAYTANSAAGGDTGTGFFNVGDEANWVINIGQGFLVESTSATTLNYNNSMRRSSNSNQFFRQDQNQTLVANPSVYWLNMTNTTGTFSQAAVGYTEDATNGVDRGIDGKNINQDFHLSSLIGAEAYSIQGRSSFEASDVVPLSYKVLTAGSYTIAIDHSTGLFSDGQRVFIKDKTNDSLYDLNAAPFTFTTEVGTFANRFEIVYQNPRETNVQTAQCGQNLTALNQNVYANLVSGAQGYRFKVTNTATNEVQTIDRVLRVFNLSQLGSFAYDKTYTVEVAVKYNNVWQPFGNACTVTTPIAYTKVQTTQCGGQLNTVNDVIYANMVNYAMGYRFRITNTTTNQSVEIDRPIRDVRLSNIGASEPNTIYTFEVAVRNTDGTYLPYGEACSIYSPINDTGRLTLEANKDQYEVIAYPNPYSDSFNLEVTTTSESQIEIKVYDMMGRLVDSKTTSVSEVTSLPLGNSYPSGVYNVIITQGENTTTQRVVRR